MDRGSRDGETGSSRATGTDPVGRIRVVPAIHDGASGLDGLGRFSPRLHALGGNRGRPVSVNAIAHHFRPRCRSVREPEFWGLSLTGNRMIGAIERNGWRRLKGRETGVVDPYARRQCGRRGVRADAVSVAVASAGAAFLFMLDVTRMRPLSSVPCRGFPRILTGRDRRIQGQENRGVPPGTACGGLLGLRAHRLAQARPARRGQGTG